MKRLLLLAMLLFPSLAFAQGGSLFSGGITVLSSSGRPIGGATITVCAFGASGIPCSPTITVYTSPTLSVTAANPGTTDGNGNLFVYASPGRYTYTVTGTGITGTSFTATVAGSGGGTGDVLSSGVNNFTNTNNFAGTTNLNGPYTSASTGTHGGTETFNALLNCQNLEGVQCVDSRLARGGIDIGDELNKAYIALPAHGGVIWLFPNPNDNVYNFTTPIVFATSVKPVRLECYGATTVSPSVNGACVLNYTPTTATNALTLDYGFAGSGSGIEPNHGIQNVTLINNGCLTQGGCGSSASGVKIGNTNGGAGQATFRMRVLGFGTGFNAVGINNYAWGMSFQDAAFVDNTLAVNMGGGTENVVFYHVKFVGNGQEFVATGGDTYFYSASFDGHTNTTGGINLNWNGRASTAFAEFTDCHFEANLNTNDKNYIIGAGNWKIKGGVLAIDATTGNVGNYFAAGGAYISILGLTVATAGQTATQIIDTTGGAVRGHVEMIFTGTYTTVPTICGGGNCAGITSTSYIADLANTVTPFSWAAPTSWLEQAAPGAGTAGSDTCYGDSTAHALECSYNNGTFGVVPLLNRVQTWTAAQTHTGAAIIPDQTSGITGTTTNNNANAGAIGEYISSTIATGASVTLTTNVTSNITSISLTAGDWDVTGAVDFTFGATTSYTNLIGSVSTTTGTIGAQDSKFDFETPAAVPTAGADSTFSLPVVRFSLSGTTTVFLVAQGTFTVSTLKAYGTIRARRIR